MLRSNNTQENLNEKYDCNSQYEEKLDEKGKPCKLDFEISISYDKEKFFN